MPEDLLLRGGGEGRGGEGGKGKEWEEWEGMCVHDVCTYEKEDVCAYMPCTHTHTSSSNW